MLRPDPIPSESFGEFLRSLLYEGEFPSSWLMWSFLTQRQDLRRHRGKNPRSEERSDRYARMIENTPSDLWRADPYARATPAKALTQVPNNPIGLFQKPSFLERSFLSLSLLEP